MSHPPAAEMTEAEILELIELLQRPAYQKLSRFHREHLVDLQREARTRKLNP